MNHDRRRILLGAAGAAASLCTLSPCAQPVSEFETLFAHALNDPESLARVRHLRERHPVGAAMAVAPREKPSSRRVADEAVRLIVLCEVTSESEYESRYQRPVWPGGKSGATMGIGYDLGYSTRTWLKEDWSGYMNPAVLAQLQTACGKTGPSVDKLIPGLRDVSVPWHAAYSQFKEKALPLYIGKTLDAIPSASKLSDKSLGALVSLVYNRGPDFNASGDRYKEMREIKSALVSAKYAVIPDLIRQMERLWEGDALKGLRHRRKAEAALFQEGLA